MELPLGTLVTPNGLYAGLWALPRPMTKHWGSGAVPSRIESVWGKIDIVFGMQDQVDDYFTVDCDAAVQPALVANWNNMPFMDKQFGMGYWDPPYLAYIDDEMGAHYRLLFPELREILRVCSQRLFILHPMVYPTPKGWRRICMIAITMGPRKIVRMVQGFERME